MSLLGYGNLWLAELLYRGPSEKRLVERNADSWPATRSSPRIFSAARVAKPVTAASMSFSFVTGWPKERLQTICCFVGGTSSISWQATPEAPTRFAQRLRESDF
ncbi:MAG: hypothetical protein ABJM11_16565 [Marinobacter sp.]|uniref:hypothetical protein n=1 Tax=Marinobacter sp. TaxID=50741 RepID=UPI00329A544F